MSNVYFNAVLLLRAVARAAPYLEAYDIETAKSKTDLVGIEKDRKARAEMNRVLEMAKNSGAGWFDEKGLFRGDDALVCVQDDSTGHRSVADLHATFSSNSAINSSTISGTYREFLIARGVTSVGSGANFKYQALGQHSRFSLNWMTRRLSEFPQVFLC